MKRGGALFLLLMLAFVLLRLPAGLMDLAVAQLSHGKLRLVDAHGSVWSGSGMLALSDGNRRLRASRALEWRFAWRRSGLGVSLHLSEHTRPQGELTLTPGGVVVERLSLDLPLDLVAASIPHPAARAGWSGRLTLHSDGLACTWQRSCEGGLYVRWFDAGLAIIPDRPLGTHELRLQALGRSFNASIATLDGDIRIDGEGQLSATGAFSLAATVTGDPEVVDRLPNVMDRNARASGETGKVIVTLP